MIARLVLAVKWLLSEATTNSTLCADLPAYTLEALELFSHGLDVSG